MITALMCSASNILLGKLDEAKFWLEAAVLIVKKGEGFISKSDEELITLAKKYQKRSSLDLLPLDIIYFSKKIP